MKLLNLIFQIIGVLAAIVTLTQFFCNKIPIPSESRNISHGLKPIIFILFLTSVIITLLILLVEPFGIFQKFELQAYDHLIQLQSDTKQDERILIITVDAEDRKYQDQLKMGKKGQSISDEALEIVLKKLNQHQPSVIGLDVYRDFPATSESLATLLKQNQHLIATCLVENGSNPYGISSPPEISEEHRLGFANIPRDPDGVIRRQFLGMAKPNNSVCQTDDSLSFQIALRYLKKEENISDSDIEFTPEKLTISNTIFHKFEFDAGGYQLPRTEDKGYQILLNYRSAREISQQIPLKEILDGSRDSLLPELVNKRIILIGTIDKTYRDLHLTPYSNNQPSKKMPGILIQAQMISQILRAVVDNRPILSWWPQWGENFWTWIWSVVGCGLGSYYSFRSPSFFQFFLAIISALLILCILTRFLFGNGLWVPIVPSTLALTLSSLAIVIIMNYFIRLQHRQKKIIA